MKKGNRKFVALLLVLFILICDQVTKLVAGLNFAITCNKGVALGIGLARPFDVILPLIFLALIIYFLTKEIRMTNIISMSIILGGGLSNLADRLTGGCVRDFIALGHFSSFNLADVAITIGVGVLVFELLLTWQRQQ